MTTRNLNCSLKAKITIAQLPADIRIWDSC
jgi:hypothetical protein